MPRPAPENGSGGHGERTPGLPATGAAVVPFLKLAASAGPDDAEMTVTPLVDGERVTINLVRLRGFDDPHVHEHHDEAVVVLEGEGMFRLGSDVVPVRSGQLVFIPAGMPHTPVVREEALVLSVFAPALDPERPDRVRVSLDDPTTNGWRSEHGS